MAAETKGPERIEVPEVYGPRVIRASPNSRELAQYVRADLHDALRARYEEAMGALRSAEYTISALRLAFDRGDTRYHECVDAAAKYRALIDRHREDGDG